MPCTTDYRYKYKELPSGRRKRWKIAPNGRVLEVKILPKAQPIKTSKTKTGKRLAKRRRQ